MQKTTKTNSCFKGKTLALLFGCALSGFSANAQQYTTTAPPPATPPNNVSNTQDRDQMCYQLGIVFPSLPPKDKDPNRPPDAYPGTPSDLDKDWTDSLGTGNTITRGSFGQWNNYHDEKVGIYTPIDLLKMKDGSKVTTVDQWWNARRPEIEKDVHEQVWGVVPPDSILPKVTWSVVVTKGGSGSSAYIQKVITGTIDISRYPSVRNVPKITATVRTPANAKGKVPVMICIGGDAGTYYNYAQPNGWGACGFDYSTLQPDNGAGLTSYLIGLVNKGNWRKPNDWGTLGAWAWGISRLIDYFETDPNVDATKIGVTGHSRNGKGTIVSMAFDQRVFIAYPSCAGSLGYKLFRRHFGQNLENHSWDQEYHWTAGNFFKWMGPLNEGQYLPRKVENCPVDGHSLLSLCAPRPVFGNSGNTGDTWQDYYGAFLSMRATSPVYELMGKKGIISNDIKPILDSAYIQGDLGFRWHNQGHTDAPDWPAFYRFAAKYVTVPYLNFTTSSFNLTDTAKKASFTVKSDTTWTVSGPSWITINPASGRLNGTINLTIERNLTNAVRIDTIRLNAPGLNEQKIVVNQSAQTLTVSPMVVAMAEAADSKATLAITSDTTWTVTGPTWLTADPTSGKLNGNVIITAQVNATGAIRTDTVRVNAPGLSEKKIVINQGVSNPTFTVTLDNLNVVAGASKDTLRISSNTVWTVSNSATWVTSSVAGGMNDKKVVLSVAANSGMASRTNTVTASAPGATPQEFVISQPGIAPTAMWLNLSSFSFISSLNIGAGAYTNSNIWPGTNSSAFSMSSSESWLTIPSGANGTPANFGGTFYLMPTIAATANTSAAPRTANLILSFPGSSVTMTLPVTQAGKTPDVTLSKSVTMLSDAAQNDTTFVAADGPWTATKSQAWLTLKKASGHIGADTLAISIAANAGSTVLIDTVKIKATGNTVAKYFIIRQQPLGATLTLSKATSTLAAAVNSKDSVKITSTAAWAVSSSESWLKLNMTAGSGTKYVTFTADQNPNTPGDRIATVTVSAVGLTDQTVAVTQKSAAPSLAVSETDINLSSVSATVPVTITSNIKWTITCTQSFVVVSTTSGSGNAMVLIKVAQNPFSPVRIATITVSGDGVASKIIKLTQASAPATLYVLPIRLNMNAYHDSTSLFVNTNSTFTLSNSDSWITSTPTTNGGTNSQIMAKVIVSPNPYITERTATVNVSVPGIPTQSFIYTQAAGPATLSLSKSSIDVEAGASYLASFDIASNASWSVTSSDAWLIPYPTSGSNNGLVTLSVQKNPTTVARTATVTVTVNGIPAQTVTLNQAAGATAIGDIEADGIETYPNPVIDKLTVKLPEGSAKIILYAVDGKEVFLLNTKDTEVDIDFTGYKPGVYFINITTDNKTIQKKLVKL